MGSDNTDLSSILKLVDNNVLLSYQESCCSGLYMEDLKFHDIAPWVKSSGRKPITATDFLFCSDDY